ncbi:MAG: hypothetical protein K1X72_19505 [Pyrinomonadaceae bacterium]|nr:hypothetical protein [Pyrinomonadaceae bacterium]
MQIIKLLISEKITNAKFALRNASSENIIELCREYLRLLDEFRDELDKLRGTPEINSSPNSLLARELIEQTRKAIRAEVELTTEEFNNTEALLNSFVSISDYDAVQTFNKLEYKGFIEWELRANEVRLKDDSNQEKFTAQEAIKIAGELRRKAYVIYRTTFFG